MLDISQRKNQKKFMYGIYINSLVSFIENSKIYLFLNFSSNKSILLERISNKFYHVLYLTFDIESYVFM